MICMQELPKQVPATSMARQPSVTGSSEQINVHREKQLKMALKCDAIRMVQSKELLENICATQLKCEPAYLVERVYRSKQKQWPHVKTSTVPALYYRCQMNIFTKEPKKIALNGVFTGTGLSRRMAKMAACKHAMEKWEEKKLLELDYSNFNDLVGLEEYY